MGMFTEMVKTAFKLAGYNPKVYFSANWEDALEEANEKEASFPWYKTSEREEIFHYSQPLYEVLIKVYSRKDYKFEYNSIDDLRVKKICRPKGFFLDDLDELIENELINRVAPETAQECFEMLRDGDVDVVSVNKLLGDLIRHDMNLEDQIVSSENAINIRRLHIIYPKLNGNSHALSYRVDRALKKMEKDGTIKAIVKKHLCIYTILITKLESAKFS